MQHRQCAFVIGVETLGGGGVIHHARLRIDNLLQLAPRGDAFIGKIRGQAEFRHREVFRVRILWDEQRVMRLAEEARVLAGRDGAVGDDVRIRDEGRHVLRAGRELVHHGTVRGKQRERIAQALVIARRGAATQRVVTRRVVVLHRVIHRADERDLVHDLGHARETLAHLDAVGAGGDRLVRPANLFRRVRLHVEHVDVARPAPLEKEDDGLGLCLRPFLERLGAEQLRKSKPEQTQSADFDHLPARERRRVEAGTGRVSMGHGSVIAKFRFGAIPVRRLEEDLKILNARLFRELPMASDSQITGGVT